MKVRNDKDFYNFTHINREPPLSHVLKILNTNFDQDVINLVSNLFVASKSSSTSIYQCNPLVKRPKTDRDP